MSAAIPFVLHVAHVFSIPHTDRCVMAAIVSSNPRSTVDGERSGIGFLYLI